MASLKILDNKKERRERLFPTQIYNDNYNYSMQYYQPMIDYLNKKRDGKKPEQLPYLPLTAERGMSRFSTREYTVQKYTPEDITVLASESEREAKKLLPDYRSTVKRSAFSVVSTADASRLTKHLTKGSIEDRYRAKATERTLANQKYEEEINKMAMSRTKYFDELKNKDLTPELRKAVRGKTSNQIRDILLAESFRGERKDDEYNAKHQVNRSVFRSASGTRLRRLQDDDEVLCYDKSLQESVDQVKRNIKNFGYKTESFLQDTR
jgi:hypothetical protein